MAQAQVRSIHEIELPRLDGKPAKLSDYAGKAVLAVNVASKCSFTPLGARRPLVTVTSSGSSVKRAKP